MVVNFTADGNIAVREGADSLRARDISSHRADRGRVMTIRIKISVASKQPTYRVWRIRARSILSVFLYSPKFNVKLNVINKYVSEIIPINKCSVVPKMSRVC